MNYRLSDEQSNKLGAVVVNHLYCLFLIKDKYAKTEAQFLLNKKTRALSLVITMPG